jgi:hypothetical protein
MTLQTVRGSKNLDLSRYEAEQAIERAAADTRARFATPDKHQIYDRKHREATRYLDAVAAGNVPPNLNSYPYMKKEVGPGKTAETALELANLWVAMNAQWEEISPVIEDISLTAKAQARSANSRADIDAIRDAALAALDGIGTPPPKRPPGKGPNQR